MKEKGKRNIKLRERGWKKYYMQTKKDSNIERQPYVRIKTGVNFLNVSSTKSLLLWRVRFFTFPFHSSQHG